ncbi:hypothetical protein SLS62_001649 [Diatrype stigma]|uniref:Uncharacterized protein n=1 Tax=Diatrype stigma TaxID=117547 RepID=A0AAN9YRM7_9PEZI
MVSGHDRPEPRKPKSTSIAEATPDAIGDPLPGLNETPTSRKRHNNPKRTEEVDELGQDEAWGSDTIGYHDETYRPRPSRRRPNATNIYEGEAVPDEEVEEPVNVVDVCVEEEAFIPAAESKVDPIEQKAASDASIIAPEVFDAAQRDHVPINQPKKRGRKKKQPVVEENMEDKGPAEEPTAPAEPDPPAQATEVEEVAEKPKRKRGRPRKSDQPKATEISAPSTRVDPHEEPAGKALDDDHKEVSPEKVAEECKPKKAAKKPGEKVNVDSDTPPEDESAILKEKDANSRTPSRSVSSEPAGKKPKEVPAATAAEDKQVKSQAKETPKPAASQPKGLYRVGLSKKTRIAPLLKIIKK